MTTFDPVKATQQSKAAMALDLTAYDSYNLFITFNKLLRSIGHSLLTVDEYSMLLTPVTKRYDTKITLMMSICQLMTE